MRFPLNFVNNPSLLSLISCSSGNLRIALTSVIVNYHPFWIFFFSFCDVMQTKDKNIGNILVYGFYGYIGNISINVFM